MAIKSLRQAKSMRLDKRAVQRTVEELNTRMGFIPDRTITRKQVREMMRADGVRPEDNEFSREIIRMRYDDE